MNSARTRLLLCLAGLATIFGCASGTGDASLPNIVLVTLDTTRADHLGCYGYFRDTSPAIDSLAAESILFERCVTPMATTLPAHISILTSTYPLEHGVTANVGQGGRAFTWSSGIRSFAVVCRDLGYRTAAFVSAAPVKRGTGIEKGFARFDEPLGPERPAGSTTEKAIDWLDENAGRPFFLWVHYFDPHYPHKPRPPFRNRFGGGPNLEKFFSARSIPPQGTRELVGSGVTRREDTRELANAYDGEILYMDTMFGRLLRRLREEPRWDETYVLVIGDHGEGLGQHGETAHGGTWREQLRVPFLIRAPGEPPRRIDRVASAVDALPTLLGRIGSPRFAPFLGQASGRNVLDRSAGGETVLSHDSGRKADRPGYRFALTSPRWKYFLPSAPGAEQLYDLAADPFELDDLAARRPEKAGEMRAVLDRVVRGQRARHEAFSRGREEEGSRPDSLLLEQLRSLGYATE